MGRWRSARRGSTVLVVHAISCDVICNDPDVRFVVFTVSF